VAYLAYLVRKSYQFRISSGEYRIGRAEIENRSQNSGFRSHKDRFASEKQEWRTSGS
jgi:hypothetical protein